MRLLLLTIILHLTLLVNVQAAPREFLEFKVDLPADWDGGERVGFSTGDRNEYMLILGKQDQEKERYLATINIFLLPNKPGTNAHDSAEALQAKQAETTPLERVGQFWSFSGDPRDNVLKGRATTFVAANHETLLIIIIKDPLNQGAQAIFKSLEPITTRAKAVLTETE
ncbi:MAG: protoporphyrinogen oxidase [Desulfovibrionaceae bacterium]|nr:protoporphyrinogen oxidase [Desulfovibrionaceae bacterium]